MIMQRTISAMSAKGSVNHNAANVRAENCRRNSSFFISDIGRYCNVNIKTSLSRIALKKHWKDSMPSRL